MYLLYSTRPKNLSKNYSIHVDAFDKDTMTYHASWYLAIPFLFLPVNRIAANLLIPFEKSPSAKSCEWRCENGGQCMKYVNADRFFCQCQSNWTGTFCDRAIDCHDCSNDSVCVGSLNNRSICVCPVNKIGPRCLLPFVCPADFCANNGQCLTIDNGIEDSRRFCRCPESYGGLYCELKKPHLEILFNEMDSPPYILIYIMTKEPEAWSTSFQIRKLTYDQRIVTFDYFELQLVFVKLSGDYYLAVAQQTVVDSGSISTTIDPNQRCLHVNELFNSSISKLPPIHRMKYYHLPCQIRSNPIYFFDEIYMCLCTLDDQADCLPFDHQKSLQCRHHDYCQNKGVCFQDDITCPTYSICICNDCYFGTRCQFYAKGFGLTLDDILRYEIQRHLKLSQQPITIKLSIGVTSLIFLCGLISGILSLLTFRQKASQRVGCGVYLFTSSITTLLMMIIFLVKFWFLLLSQTDVIVNRLLLQLGCKLIEYFLKFCIYADSWLNGCVAIERASAVVQGIQFNKLRSKRIAKRIILFLAVSILTTIVHEPIFRDLYDDEEEKRTWCVTHYSTFLQYYNSTVTLIHFLVPFLINFFSALFIIFMTARQRSKSQYRFTSKQHLYNQFLEHKQILISPIALVILSLPRLIISLIADCIRSSRNPWLYLVGHFISFAPSILIFPIFVLPSELYRKQFKEAMLSCRKFFQRCQQRMTR